MKILRKSFLSACMVVAVMLMAGTAMAAPTVTIQTNGGADFATTNAMENVVSYASIGGGGTALDVMFVLDSSGSMSWNDPSGLRKQAAINLINSLPAGSNVAVAVGDFDSYSSVVSSFTDNYPTTADYSDAIAAINNINSSGGTNLNAGLAIANTEFQANGRAGSDWVEIFLTDGQGSYTHSGLGGPIDTAASLGITVYSFGLVGGSDADLQDMADATGGAYYHTTDPSALPDLFSGIGGNTIIGAEYELDDGTILDAYGTYAAGFFNEDISLHMGANPIIARAFGSDGSIGEDLITITRGGTTPVPEPSTMLLVGAGLIGMVAFGRKRSKK